jgi:ELWxxDGT repeat protein
MPKTKSSNILSMASYSGGVMFGATEPINANEIWKSKGTSVNTVLVDDLASGTSSTNPTNITSGENKVFFTTNSSSLSAELYSSDGTVSGTNTIGITSQVDSPADLFYLNGILFFTNQLPNIGKKLWRYQSGSSASTLKVLNPNNLGDNIANLTAMDNLLFFTGSDGNTNGNELWKSNGTSAGTVLVKDILIGSSSSNPTSLAANGSTLFFSANNGTNGAELWKSDGTSGGTTLVKDIRAGAAGSTILKMTPGGNLTYFTADDGISGVEIWTTDGSNAGTSLLSDIVIGTGSSLPGQLTYTNGTLFFVANDGINGAELWITDGTQLGTTLLKDINLGSEGSNIKNLSVAGDFVFFSANDGVNGQELWKSNGTEAGTVMISDIYPGSAGSNPELFTYHGDTLFFTADHPDYGNELWSVFTQCMLVDFSASTACEMGVVSFTNTTIDLGTTINNYSWDFGDGSSSTDNEPSKVYTTAGSYIVSLTAENTDGCSRQTSKTIIIYPFPSADFTVSKDTLCRTGNQFFFTNTTSTANGILSYAWSFGDGSTNTAANPSKSYTANGDFVVRLISTVQNICRDTVYKEVTVLPSPSTGSILGKTITFSPIDTFSVLKKTGSLYQWTIIGGTQLSGGNTDSITVNWNVIPSTATIKVIETNKEGCIGSEVSKGIQVKKISTASINELSKENAFSLFPNPAQKKVQISSAMLRQGRFNVLIINSLGQIVGQINWASPSQEENLTFPVDQLADGIYSIVVQSDYSIWRTKLIVRK